MSRIKSIQKIEARANFRIKYNQKRYNLIRLTFFLQIFLNVTSCRRNYPGSKALFGFYRYVQVSVFLKFHFRIKDHDNSTLKSKLFKSV